MRLEGGGDQALPARGREEGDHLAFSLVLCLFSLAIPHHFELSQLPDTLRQNITSERPPRSVLKLNFQIDVNRRFGPTNSNASQSVSQSIFRALEMTSRE